MTTENLPGPAQRAGENEEVRAEDGLRLRLWTARLTAPARAELLLTHGLGEHAGRYAHVAAALAERGIRVRAYDLRGHGRSAGRRGDLAYYNLLLDDLRAVHAQVRASGLPVFLFGHSLGGQVTLRYLQRDRPAVAGAVIAAPWLRLAFAPPGWKLAVARLALHLLPQFRFPTGMQVEGLTRDRAHIEAMADGDLVTDTISARMFFAVQAAGELALQEGAKVDAPLLLLHGDADPITDWRVTEQLYRLPSAAEKTWKLYPGALHEAHNDVGREEMLRDIGEWIAARC